MEQAAAASFQKGLARHCRSQRAKSRFHGITPHSGSRGRRFSLLVVVTGSSSGPHGGKGCPGKHGSGMSLGVVNRRRPRRPGYHHTPVYHSRPASARVKDHARGLLSVDIAPAARSGCGLRGIAALVLVSSIKAAAHWHRARCIQSWASSLPLRCPARSPASTPTYGAQGLVRQRRACVGFCTPQPRVGKAHKHDLPRR